MCVHKIMGKKVFQALLMLANQVQKGSIQKSAFDRCRHESLVKDEQFGM